MTCKQGYRMSGSHEIPVYFNTWTTFLISNSNPNNDDRLPLRLHNGVYNDLECVLLCDLQFSQEYLAPSTYSSVITLYGLILFTVQSLLWSNFIVMYSNSLVLFYLCTIHVLFAKPLVASDLVIEYPSSN